MNSLLPEIEQFLYREARLLDTDQLEAWLELFTSDAIYWVPAGHDDIDPTRHVSIIYDTRLEMQKRVARLRSGYAHAEDPKSRTHRAVSNVEMRSLAENGRYCTVSSIMVLFVLARHKQRIHSARCEFHLVRGGDDWRIARKKVGLLGSNEALDGISYLL